MEVNYRFGTLIFVHQKKKNKQTNLTVLAEVCAWSKSRASRLSRYKNGNLLYRWKEIFFDFFWRIWINLYRARTEAAGL